MWHKRIRKFVETQIGLRIRRLRCAQQTQPHHVSKYIVSVFAVIQQRHAVVVFGKVDPFLRAHLESRHIPIRVHVRRPLSEAVLNFIGRTIRMYLDGKGDLKKPMGFLPIDLRMEIYPA